LVQGRLRNEPARPAIAFSFLTVAACGLLHLARGAPALADWPGLRDAGGAVGALVAGPLRTVVAGWGAGVVLGSLAVVSLLVLTRTPVQVVSGAAARAAQASVRRARAGARRLVNLGRRRRLDASVGRHPASGGEAALGAPAGGPVYDQGA